MKTLLLSLLLALNLTACGSLTSGTFDNRIVCTVAKDEVHVISKYGPVGISARVSDKDLIPVCGTPTVVAPVTK